MKNSDCVGICDSVYQIIYTVKSTLKGTSNNKSLSIKGSLIFPINDNVYNFNLYIKGNCL